MNTSTENATVKVIEDLMERKPNQPTLSSKKIGLKVLISETNAPSTEEETELEAPNFAREFSKFAREFSKFAREFSKFAREFSKFAREGI
jgi:hypothetical protein